MPAGTDEAADRHANTPQVLVWDPLVRVGHWLLVVLFFVAYFTDDDLITIHSWAGYGVGIYVLVRVIWGFIGPKHARFSDFAYGPASAAQYLKDMMLFRAKRYLGHSPAGALMIFALLGCLALITVTGVALLAVEENAGPLAPWLGRGVALEQTLPDPALFTARASEDDEDQNEDEKDDELGENNDEEGAEALEEMHEFVSNLTLFLVLLHILGVTLTSIAHRENLVRAMITGHKRAE